MDFINEWSNWYEVTIVPYLKTSITGIFYIKNLTDNKVFIGQGTNIYARYKDLYERVIMNEGRGWNIRLVSDMRRLGPQAFSFKIIQVCGEKELNERTMHWIKVFNAEVPQGYNRKFVEYERGLETVKKDAAFLATASLILKYEFWYYLIQELKDADFVYNNAVFEYHRPKVKATEVAEKMGITRQTISGYLKALPEVISVDRLEDNGYAIIKREKIDEMLSHCRDFKTIKEKNNYCRLVLYMLTKISFFGGRYDVSMEGLQRDLGRAKAAIHSALETALEKGIIVRTSVGNSITGRSSTYTTKK